ncbi:hypothetical protein AND_009435 [Anopheles darlingi]|uniref:Uncharacterized protein n=1 Tax=Anopheles darlingi TaxID=43151 RepID=W5J6E4_ANODA|nr:hypothetical protein AND_009435 [Anopheles darlingi]
MAPVNRYPVVADALSGSSTPLLQPKQRLGLGIPDRGLNSTLDVVDTPSPPSERGGCCGSMKKRTIVGGWAWAWWLVTDVQRLSLEVMTLNPMCEMVETAQGVALTVTGVAQCKIMKFVPDYSSNESPFLVKLSNHTLFGYCMKLYVEWLPNSVNLTIVCDCPESEAIPVNETIGVGDIDYVPQLVHEEWPIFQLVHVKKNKFAVIYGCKDHGNGSVSEGAIVMGTTVRNLEEYNELYRTTIIQSFWQYNRELFDSMKRYTMDHQTIVGCHYRREYYLIRGTTIADIVFIVVGCLMMMNVYYFHHQADELLGTASEQFLGKSVKEIKTTILQTLEGHLRAILALLRDLAVRCKIKPLNGLRNVPFE